MFTSRLNQYRDLKNPAASSGSGEAAEGSGRLSGAAKRRQEALERQRQQRQTAFSLTRQGLDSIVDDLALSDSDDEDETSINEPGAGAPTPSASSLVPQTAGHDGSHGAPSKKTVSRKIKRKWRVYADKLMVGESLDFSHQGDGIPEDLFSEWLLMGPVPKGKRCMAVTFTNTRVNRRGRVTNTLILARSSGRPLSRHLVPVLPPDCILDCIYVESTATLFVLDVMRWKGQSIAECEAEFRMFWRDSKLAELPPQPLPSQTIVSEARQVDDMEPTHPRHKPAQLVVLPVPCMYAPIDPRALDSLLGSAQTSPHSTSTYQALILSSVGPMEDNDTEGHLSVVDAQTTYELDGLLLLVRDATYESGLTPLAAWIGRDSLSLFAGTLAKAGLGTSHQDHDIV